MSTKALRAVTICVLMWLGAMASTDAGARSEVPAYWIATMTLRDPDAFSREFMPLVTKVFAEHGRVYLSRGGKIVPLKGEPPRRIVILRFPSIEAAQAAYASPAYKDARKIGDQFATFESIIVVEGLAP